MDVLLTEIIATHLCHEFAGPLGAIGNSVELLEDTSSAIHAQALQLMQMSAKDAIARLQYYRIAYGLSAGEGDADLGMVQQVAAQYIERKKAMRLSWNDLPLMSALAAKLLLNCISLVLGRFKATGEIIVGASDLPANAIFKVTGHASQWKMQEEYLPLLAGAAPMMPMTLEAAIHAYAYVQAQKLHYKIEYALGEETFSLLVSQG